jgi:protein-tyrosine phosphatase
LQKEWFLMDLIRPNLYLGDRHDVNFRSLKDAGITAILNVANEVASPHQKDFRVCKAGFHDSAQGAKESAPAAAELLNELLDNGETVLVHCLRGASRSPHVVALCLSEREGKKYNEVYAEIRGIRPRVMAYSLGQEIKDKYDQ